MSKLQSNFTTLEQSRMLLELGVPADSADCFYDHYRNLEVRTYSKLASTFFETYTRFTPCWSVGRLIEILEIVGENAGQCVSTTKSTSRIESLVQLYEENATLLDFSKLEE